MNKKHRLLKVFKTLVLGLIVATSLTGCGGNEKWNEEVQLSDGKVIIIERELIMEGGGAEWASNRSLSIPKEYRIQFANLSNSKKLIEWHSTKKSPQTWPEIPLVFDRVNGEWLVFSSVEKAGGCLMYNKYLYQRGIWVEEKLPPTFEQRVTNLYTFGHKDFKNFIDVKTKEEFINEHGGIYPYARYDQVGPTHPNCKGL